MIHRPLERNLGSSRYLQLHRTAGSLIARNGDYVPLSVPAPVQVTKVTWHHRSLTSHRLVKSTQNFTLLLGLRDRK